MSNKPDGIFGLFDVVRDFYAHGIDEHPWVLINTVRIEVSDYIKEPKNAIWFIAHCLPLCRWTLLEFHLQFCNEGCAVLAHLCAFVCGI